jgi:UDP-N-acetylmuramoylalanine--D-glutamate ligase
MIPVTTRKDQQLAVFGLGASGRATAHALAAGGARVSTWDDNAASRDAAAAEHLPLADLAAADWTDFAALVLSPGVPLTHPAPHPVVVRANDAGKPVLGDIELLREACPDALMIGVTGTNGKSTTTALIHHILKACGRPVQIGGNFGPPVLGMEPPAPGEALVLELSSYQLDLTHAATFEIAVLINVSPDHLDRHGDMAGYLAAKKRIFRTRTAATAGQLAIVGVDDTHCRAVRDEIAARDGWRTIPISVGRILDGGVYAIDGTLFDALDGAADGGHDISGIDTLRGPHNWQNAAIAWAVARAQGLAAIDIAAALRTFPGLPHRMEPLGEIAGVRYINDSKATNGEAAARALSSFTDIHWIAGGIAKEDGLAPCAPFFGNVAHAYLIGAAADAFDAEIAGRVPVTRSGDLATALADARRNATPGSVVLLSPACASFDQFANFGARGDAFRDLVSALLAGGAA